MNENDLINRSAAMEVIKKHDFTMRKKYGQNGYFFLTWGPPVYYDESIP